VSKFARMNLDNPLSSRMTGVPPPESSRPEESLSIGDVSERTGLTPATLRMWELRHGFPMPQRLESGHRRYAAGDVEVILDVLRRRDGGVRLDVAVGQAVRASTNGAEPDAPSVFAELRARHPHLPTYRLRKPTLLALSWAIEDEFCAKAERAYLFAAFQRRTFFEAAERRWAELARVAKRAFVYADFPAHTLDSAMVRVPLPADAPLRREWAVVCDAPGLAIALSAFELPGQDALPDRERVFESAWTLDPRAVRDAARVCAQAAAAVDVPEARPALYDLAEDPVAAAIDPVAATAVFNRVVAYVDRFAVR
jgi:MerR family transcriptional regulator, light-induced transcriptional regulator